jgi:hypothetical protein
MDQETNQMVYELVKSMQASMKAFERVVPRGNPARDVYDGAFRRVAEQLKAAEKRLDIEPK